MYHVCKRRSVGRYRLASGGQVDEFGNRFIHCSENSRVENASSTIIVGSKNLEDDEDLV